MTQTQQTILQIIQEVYRSTFAPVSTTSVATRYGMDPNHLRRRYLLELEQNNVIRRVGMRKGWLPANC